MKDESLRSARLLGRRNALVKLGGAALFAHAPLLHAAPALSRMPQCVVRPEQTEGPFFVDQKLNRADIRSDPASGAVKAGVPLRVTFNVSRVSGSACVPLEGAMVDLWHCDAAGQYSGVRDRTASTVGERFLRGYQLTDTNGAVTFSTIYPGWYPGRAVHLHFKVRTRAGRRAHEFTSQIYFDDDLSDRILGKAPYSTRGRRDVRNAMDGLFARGGSQLLLSLEPQDRGYAGLFSLALGAI